MCCVGAEHGPDRTPLIGYFLGLAVLAFVSRGVLFGVCSEAYQGQSRYGGCKALNVWGYTVLVLWPVVGFVGASFMIVARNRSVHAWAGGVLGIEAVLVLVALVGSG